MRRSYPDATGLMLDTDYRNEHTRSHHNEGKNYHNMDNRGKHTHSRTTLLEL
jgi:hypothetical protein